VNRIVRPLWLAWASLITLSRVVSPQVAPRMAAAVLAGYGASIALLGYLNLLGLLLVAAHAVTVGRACQAGPGPGSHAAGRRLLRGWIIAAAAGSVAVTPVALLGWRERSQIGWLAAPGWPDVQTLVTTMLAGSVLSAVVIGMLGVLGAVRRDWPPAPAQGPPCEQLTWLCVPWLVPPPAILLGISQWMHVYNFSYVLFCLPAVALLAGAGLAVLPMLWRAGALGLLIIVTLHTQHAIRQTDALICWGGSWSTSGGVPDWAYAYPYGFTKPRNIGKGESPAAAGDLFGRAVPLNVLEQRLQTTSRVWVAELGRKFPRPPVLPRQFRLIKTWPISDIWLQLYVR